MNTPSSSDDRPGGPEPAGGAPESEPGRSGDGPQEHGGQAAAPDGAGDPAAEEAEDGGDEEFAEAGSAAPHAAPGSGGGLLGAETFAVGAVLAVSGALVGPRLVQMLSSVTAQDQVGAVAGTIVGDAVVALVGVVLGLVGIGLADAASRPWTRWAAGAAVLVGLLFAAASVAAYLLVPAPVPAPMGPSM